MSRHITSMHCFPLQAMPSDVLLIFWRFSLYLSAPAISHSLVPYGLFSGCFDQNPQGPSRAPGLAHMNFVTPSVGFYCMQYKLTGPILVYRSQTAREQPVQNRMGSRMSTVPVWYLKFVRVPNNLRVRKMLGTWDTIAMKSYGRHGVLDHWQLNCFSAACLI